jgi:CRISPR-associated endonuclease/helicase Cas3
MELTAREFEAFFRELHGVRPFPWQQRLAELVCESSWPRHLDLPTASGKTACLDVAVFAMAALRRGPRRVFFVVDRRVVVDAAFDRMNAIRSKLREASGGVLKEVAGRLREMGQGAEPLDVYQLRGGIYRDDSWVRSPLQPALIASTVDQVGSRLLFRGYGAGEKVQPMHAALAANDALILLDEAHCSKPFSQTVDAVERYRKWAIHDIKTPFAFVEMTATPAQESDQVFRLGSDDYQDPELRKRLFAPKPARLLVNKTRAKDFDKIAETLTEKAIRLAEKPGLRRIAIMVNRVRTARLVYERLRERGRAHLLIGRMRPADRSALSPELMAMMSGKPRKPDDHPVFVVATQCLEVGADLDFDAMVTECASIDALLQRFGRLDRTGDLHASGVTSEGRIVIAQAMTDAKYRDPIYGDALSKTWQWLSSGGDAVEFGICSDAGDATVREKLNSVGDQAAALRREAPACPLLLPAHVDALAQTSPAPALEPDVALYLHGVEAGSPEVQVVWRADLDVAKPELWAEIVALCPPVSAEAMAVPLRDFRTWLTNNGVESVSSDIEGIDRESKEEQDVEPRCHVLRWRGNESELIGNAGGVRRIQPGDTLVLAVASGGWDELGHIPPGAQKDIAEQARMLLRRGWVLRLHAELLKQWPECEPRDRLIEFAGQAAPELGEVLPVLEEYACQPEAPDWLREIPHKTKLEAYPTDDEAPAGWVLSGQFSEADAGEDESSVSRPVFLDEHSSHVKNKVEQLAFAAIGDSKIREGLARAAEFHDSGKADPRFQALLHGGDGMAAQFAPRLLAKGTPATKSRREREAQFRRSGLPDGFRHELISLRIAQNTPETPVDDLALHLIASHHGRCRPFAPVVVDNGTDPATAAHCLDIGVAERFWKLTRTYGWWGLAYLEALLRLGDWKASEEENT